MQHTNTISIVLGVTIALSVTVRVSAAPPKDRPRMYFADDVSGRPFSKDPAVVKFKGKYWLYYSIPPYERKPSCPPPALLTKDGYS